MNDLELVEAWNKGNESAFTELFNRHNNNLVQRIYLRTRFFNGTEDICQEAWIRFIRYRHKYRATNLLNFLITLAWQCYIDYIRADRIKTCPLYDEIEEEKEKDLDVTPLHEMIMKMESENQKEVVLMRTYFGTPFRFIAQKMNTSQNTALGRYRYGVDNLKKSYDRSKENQSNEV